MDKVIIDRVDVSGCERFIEHTKECIKCETVYDVSCEGNNCIYKQLKRAKAEHDDLHLSYAGCKTANTGLQELNEKLQAENERLKKECTLYDCGNKEWAIEYKKLEDDYTELIDRLDDISYDKSNYYQTLQEIRDIAEKEIVCDNCNFEGTDKCDARMCTHFYLNDFSKDILAKINEVIGEE